MNTVMAVNTLNAHLSSLDLHWTWDHDTSIGVGEASQNVWRRAYRRGHDRKKNEFAAVAGVADIEMGGQVADKKVALAFRISVDQHAKDILLEWLRGSDQVLWESFCGMLHRVFTKG
jgi:23S rRNA (adenine1618-N6)-methyltransferase